MDQDADDLMSGLYKALDRLEEVDPQSRNEPWFKLVERELDEVLKPIFQQAMERPKH